MSNEFRSELHIVCPGFRILCYKVYTMSKGAHEVCEGTFLLALPASLMMMLCDRFIF